MGLDNFNDLMLVLILMSTVLTSIGVIMSPRYPKLGTYICYIGCISGIVIIIFSILLCGP
jgi:hypothetical protein